MIDERKIVGGATLVVVVFLVAVAIFATGCDEPVELPAEVDVCAVEGVEDCCPDYEDFHRLGYEIGFHDGYSRALYDQKPDEEKPKPTPRPAKPRKRKKPQKAPANLKDLDLEDNDPLGGLSHYEQCRVECIPNPWGGMTCRKICNGRPV